MVHVSLRGTYKTVAGGVVTEYTQSRKKHRPPEDENGRDTLSYGAQGKPGMVRFNETDYFYVYDLQGDVVGLIANTSTGINDATAMQPDATTRS